MEQEKIGRFLGKVRRERGLTQEQLAQRLGVSQRTVSRWETGRNMPDISMLTALCAQLDITVAELLAGTDYDGGSSFGAGRAAAELWLVYVLEGIIALFGLVFIRYFLTL